MQAPNHLWLLDSAAGSVTPDFVGGVGAVLYDGATVGNATTTPGSVGSMASAAAGYAIASLDGTKLQTIEAWINKASISYGQSIFSVPAYNFSVYFGGTTSIAVGIAGVYEDIAPAGFDLQGSWFHLAVVLYDAETRVFVNGTKIGTFARANNLTASDLHIGHFVYGGSNYYLTNGYIDSFATYTTTLSDADVAIRAVSPVVIGGSVALSPGSVLSASGQALPPPVTATAAIVSAPATAAGSGAVVSPSVTASAVVTAGAAILAAIGDFVGTLGATAALVAGGATMAATAAVTAPGFSAAAALGAAPGTMAGAGVVSPPIVSAAASVTAPAPIAAGSSVATVPSVSAAAVLISAPAVVVGYQVEPWRKPINVSLHIDGGRCGIVKPKPSDNIFTDDGDLLLVADLNGELPDLFSASLIVVAPDGARTTHQARLNAAGDRLTAIIAGGMAADGYWQAQFNIATAAGSYRSSVAQFRVYPGL